MIDPGDRTSNPSSIYNDPPSNDELYGQQIKDLLELFLKSGSIVEDKLLFIKSCSFKKKLSSIESDIFMIPKSL